MKKLNVIKLIFLLNILLLSNIQESSFANENGGLLTASVLSFQNGTLEIEIGFKFSEKKAIYNWHGYIYPVFGSIINVSAKTPNGKELEVKIPDKVLPKLGFPSDAYIVKNYIYPKALKLLIKENGTPYRGCMSLVIVYNTQNTEHKYLSKLKLESEIKNICENNSE